MMWNNRVEVIYEPLCEFVPEDLVIFIPVCRDELRAKYERIMHWRLQDYEFEKVNIKCTTCER